MVCYILRETGITVIRVFSVRRPQEDDVFRAELSNKQLLFHATRPHHLAAILSRFDTCFQTLLSKFYCYLLLILLT